MNTEQRDRYFQELGVQLRQAGFTTRPPDQDGLLPVEWQDRHLCRATEDGGVRYKQEHVTGPESEAAKGLAVQITRTTAEYMSLIEHGRLSGAGAQ